MSIGVSLQSEGRVVIENGYYILEGVELLESVPGVGRQGSVASGQRVLLPRPELVDASCNTRASHSNSRWKEFFLVPWIAHRFFSVLISKSKN